MSVEEDDVMNFVVRHLVIVLLIPKGNGRVGRKRRVR